MRRLLLHNRNRSSDYPFFYRNNLDVSYFLNVTPITCNLTANDGMQRNWVIYIQNSKQLSYTCKCNLKDNYTIRYKILSEIYTETTNTQFQNIIATPLLILVTDAKCSCTRISIRNNLTD